MITQPPAPTRKPEGAFTLIELLVVIAIIAVLAALLFPVFAQAKLAAKKTQDLSNLKQLNLGTAMYLSDHDDLYPLASIKAPDGHYDWGGVWDFPWDVRGGQSETYYEAYRVYWANSVQPYVKSLDLYRAPDAQALLPDFGAAERAQWVKKPAVSSYAMNGLLEGYSASAIARPSQLVVFGAPNGGRGLLGAAITSPYLYCFDPNQPCRYVPPRPGCDGSINGEWSSNFGWPDIGLPLRASFGTGSNVAYADGSAKFRRMFANRGGKTDFHTDPFTQYDAGGDAAFGWFDTNYCHALLFRPDFEFEAFGQPVEGN